MKHCSNRRRALTLAELLIASAVMAILALALATLATSVQLTTEYSRGVALAVQHARVAVERIERAASEAAASESFPAFAVFGETVGADFFPHTLVVWRPAGAAADPDGLPRFDELVIFTPDPASPNRLLEITLPGDARTVPYPSDAASWNSELAIIRSDGSLQRTALTDLLKTADAGGGTTLGCLRFAARQRPSQSQWSDYQNSTVAWEELDWVQDLFGSEIGLRQSWCRFEMQLLPQPGAAADEAIPFFGSAAVYHELKK